MEALVAEASHTDNFDLSWCLNVRLLILIVKPFSQINLYLRNNLRRNIRSNLRNTQCRIQYLLRQTSPLFFIFWENPCIYVLLPELKGRRQELLTSLLLSVLIVFTTYLFPLSSNLRFYFPFVAKFTLLIDHLHLLLSFLRLWFFIFLNWLHLGSHIQNLLVPFLFTIQIKAMHLLRLLSVRFSLTTFLTLSLSFLSPTEFQKLVPMYF